MTLWVRTCCGALLLAAFSTRAGEPHEVDVKIAKCAVIIGCNRLAGNIEDEQGRILLTLGARLLPQTTAPKILKQVKRGKPPVPRRIGITSDRLLQIIIQRADYLSKEMLPKNLNVGAIALAYYHTAAALDPGNEGVNIGIMRLMAWGISGNRKEAFANDFDLKVCFAEAKVPKSTPGRRLTADDRTIVQGLAELGAIRMANDPGDSLGLLLTEVAGALNPFNERFLLTMAAMLNQKEVDAAGCTTVSDTLLTAMGRRVKTILASTEDDLEALTLVSIYTQTAKAIGIDRAWIDDSLQALAVLEVKGEFRDLLAGDTVFLPQEPVVVEENPDSLWGPVRKPLVATNPELMMQLDEERPGAVLEGALGLSKAAAQARKHQGKAIKCSPQDLSMLKRLKPHSVIRFAPGEYPEKAVEVTADHIIIEAVPQVKIPELHVTGKACVVRSIDVGTLLVHDALVIDSHVRFAKTTTRGSGRFYNCLVDNIFPEWESSVDLEFCTVIETQSRQEYRRLRVYSEDTTIRLSRCLFATSGPRNGFVKSPNVRRYRVEFIECFIRLHEPFALLRWRNGRERDMESLPEDSWVMKNCVLGEPMFVDEARGNFRLQMMPQLPKGHIGAWFRNDGRINTAFD